MAATKIQRDVTVKQNTRLNQRHFVLTLKSDDPLPEMLPGQFVQVLVEDSPSTFLRRPFSIHEINYRTKTFNLLVQIKGEGSRHLSLLKKGSSLNVIYPLGNSFSMPSGNKVLLVGGGCGVAPLLFLAQTLKQKGIQPDILVGFRSKDDIFEREEYEKFGNLLIITDDGTEGEKGIVTDHSLLQKEKLDYDCIYCCGPDPMMKSVAGIAAMHGIDCEVSLENLMACGFGVCLCCITPTDKGNERVCVEGPVFNTKKLRW
ncbi:MAG: dihydroorotate dehydrogenase electron transfer subunit [Syntrophothermus sp.]